MYAVHEYQSQILGDYDAYLFPFILSHPLFFVPLSLKPVRWL